MVNHERRKENNKNKKSTEHKFISYENWGVNDLIYELYDLLCIIKKEKCYKAYKNCKTQI